LEIWLFYHVGCDGVGGAGDAGVFLAEEVVLIY
jgi:hypothetical protein